jgi:hypothetical protein
MSTNFNRSADLRIVAASVSEWRFSPTRSRSQPPFGPTSSSRPPLTSFSNHRSPLSRAAQP